MSFRSVVFALFCLFALAGCRTFFTDSRAEDRVTVDLLSHLNLKSNALAPQTLLVDPQRNRIFVACANSSAVAIIQEGPYDLPAGTLMARREAPEKAVFTLPVGSRMPRRLRPGGMALSTRTGRFYLLGEACLIVVDGDRKTARSIPLPGDFEAIALDESLDRAYLTGRTCMDLAVVNAQGEVDLIPCLDPAPPLPFMAASAPPPIRFPFVDSQRNRVYLVDGCTSTLLVIDGKKKRLLNRRKLPLDIFPRWHTAGFCPARGRIYTVLENDRREARQAVAIDCSGEEDWIVDLPENNREPAGISGDPERSEIYIPYDNHPHLHVVAFGEEEKIIEVKLPDLGVNATAYDPATRRLYAAGWKQAALYMVDLEERRRTHTIPFFPVYPHTHNLALNPLTRKLYLPSGATAVNGTFGSAITVFDTRTLDRSRIQTGWAPVSLAPVPGSDRFFVFGVERSFAEISPDGTTVFHTLPHPYPRQALADPQGRGVWVAYGPHSSFWPAFYIGATRHGIYLVDGNGRLVLNRMTPRLVQDMIFDSRDQLWAFQNTWGKEEPYLMSYPAGGDGWPTGWSELRLPPKVDNECLLRCLAVDKKREALYAVKTGDRNTEPGLLYVLNPVTREITSSHAVGITPSSIAVDERSGRVFVTNFDEDTVSVFDPAENRIETRSVGRKPLASAVHPATGAVYVLNHLGESLTLMGEQPGTVPLPAGALPNNLLVDPLSNQIFVTAHNEQEARIYCVEAKTGKVKTLLREPHPYGAVTFDQANSAFQVRGQWGDGIFRITQMAVDAEGRLWVTDYLSGKVWILKIKR